VNQLGLALATNERTGELARCILGKHIFLLLKVSLSHKHLLVLKDSCPLFFNHDSQVIISGTGGALKLLPVASAGPFEFKRNTVLCPDHPPPTLQPGLKSSTV